MPAMYFRRFRMETQAYKGEEPRRGKAEHLG
jgi:hypothetical protein